jgi:FdhD protein
MMASLGEDAMAELRKVKIHRISDCHIETCFDLVISEAEVVLRLNGEVYRSFYCLPTHLEELARGHLVSEGICHSSNIKVVEVKRDGSQFVIFVTSDGRNPIRMKGVSSQAKISVTEIWDAMKRLDENSILFKETGGTHIAQIYNQRSYIFAEDISRHCAIDKVIGLAFGTKVDLANSALVTSSRQTKSIVMKAARVQIPVLISISAPTSLAIEAARKFGITLLGFTRGHRFNIYSHEWRVIDNG